MAEVNTSSYPKPRPSKSLLDQVQQYQTLESNAIAIEKSKLDLVNQNYGNLIQTLNALPPEATLDDMKKWGQEQVRLKRVNPKLFAEFVTNMPPSTGDPVKDAAAARQYRDMIAARMMTNQEAINFQYGQQGIMQGGQTDTPIATSPRFGMRPTGDPIQRQPEIGTEYTDPKTNQVRRVGPIIPVIPEGAEQVPGGVPGQYRPTNKLNNVVDTPLPKPRPEIQSTNKIVGDREGVEKGIYPPSSFNDRFGLIKRAPGEVEAEVATGQQSGQALAAARQRASTFAQDMFPVTEALSAAKNLGTKGSGPGSETVNYLKSFILTNLPGVQENDPEFKNINDFDKLQKYLVQIAKTTGNTSTNDQLAASFAGNPNVKMSNAATQDVLASIYALRSLDLAKTKMWEKQNLPDSQYAKWAAKWDNDIDLRVFGLQFMRPDAIIKLDKSLKGKAREKFNNSVDIARDAGLM
mgnify:CR=1 FL=1